LKNSLLGNAYFSLAQLALNWTLGSTIKSQRHNPSVYLSEPDAPHTGQVGTLPRLGAVSQDRDDSRFASFVTVLILLATLILLGFSIYLAVQLGFIKLPFH
jgi:hypothetical protein